MDIKELSDRLRIDSDDVSKDYNGDFNIIFGPVNPLRDGCYDGMDKAYDLFFEADKQGINVIPELIPFSLTVNYIKMTIKDNANENI